MGRSIIGQVKMLGVLAFALPAIAAGLDIFFREGNPWGAALVVIGIAMILVEKYIDTPFDLPEKVAGEAISAVVKEPEDDSFGDSVDDGSGKK
ncbi:DUF7533 family protein [Haloarchaeobius sp. TZWWS8]|uniref:DUF7533 family protein n=1 Tax=Haloarchaeobius sp. TZWWS8 TaxID=3446121 RepID=UPI003EBB6BBC